MKNFSLNKPAALAAASRQGAQPRASFIAGGTTVIDLWKLGAYPVDDLIDLGSLDLHGISADPQGMRVGALETMSEVGSHPAVKALYPVVSQSLLLSASPQIRNMGTMGGNLLQRPRSITYRNPDPTRQDGPSRFDALFGVTPLSSAPHPSDLAVALLALDATLRVFSPSGSERMLKLSDFYILPQTSLSFASLAPGEIITAIEVTTPGRRSSYVKVRDRASYQFAVVSAAVVLDMDGNTIRKARVAAGGVGTIPWRFPKVEAALAGQAANATNFLGATSTLASGATPHAENQFKIPLLQQTLVQALQEASSPA